MTINAWGSDVPVTVPQGGTGVTTLTSHGVLIGSGTGAVTATAAPTDGQVLIGSSGADPVLATISGTSNEIVSTTGAGSQSFGIADNPIWPGTGGIRVPTGTTAERPGSPINGMFRFNTDDNVFEGYQDDGWVQYGDNAPGNQWVLLDSGTASSSVTYTISNSIITSAYTEYMVLCDVSNGSAQTAPELRFSVGGSVTSSGYAGQFTYSCPTENHGALSSSFLTKIISDGFSHPSVTYSVSFVSNLTVANAWVIAQGFGASLVTNFDTDLAPCSCKSSGGQGVTTAADGLRLSGAGGSNWKVSVYGRTAS